MVCFRVNEPLALDEVQELGGDRDAARALPLGSFVSWNRLSQARLDGRVFQWLQSRWRYQSNTGQAAS